MRSFDDMARAFVLAELRAQIAKLEKMEADILASLHECQTILAEMEEEGGVMCMYRVRRNRHLLTGIYIFREGNKWHTDTHGATVLRIDPHQVYEYETVAEMEHFLSEQAHATITLVL